MCTTAWSAKAIEERTSIPWRKAKEAVQALVDADLIRRDNGGQHPRYTILPALDFPGCVPGANRPAQFAMLRTAAYRFTVDESRTGVAIEPKPVSRLPAFGEADEVLVVIETPKGSRNKYAYDDRLEVFELKGVMPEGSSFPYDYGFIPSTKGGDGDPLDILVIRYSFGVMPCSAER